MKGPACLTKLSGAALFSNRVRVMHSLHKGANTFAQLLNQNTVPINLLHHCFRPVGSVVQRAWRMH